MQPVLVPRAGDYHATDWSGGFPSATAVRGAISRGDWLRVSQALPQRSYALLRAAVQRGELFHPQVLDPVLLHLLRTTGPEACASCPDAQRAWKTG